MSLQLQSGVSHDKRADKLIKITIRVVEGETRRT
jgi:hypothetical protein